MSSSLWLVSIGRWHPALRQLLSDRFGLDSTDRHMRDAVKSLALEHCFNPVADMLAEAEASWDGVRASRPHGGGLSQLRRYPAECCLRAQDYDRGRGAGAETRLQVRHHTVLEGPRGGTRAWLAGAGRRGEFLRREDYRKGEPEVQEQLSASGYTRMPNSLG